LSQVNVRSLGRNSLYAWLMQVWQIGSRFIITPLIIAKVGLAGYGTWTLLFGICAYVSIFDTSFGFAYTKFTAEYDKKQDYRGLSEIISSGIALITTLAFLGLVAIWFLRGYILRVLNVPTELLGDAEKSLMIVATCFLLRMSVGSVYQVLSGLQRMDLQYKLLMMASAIEFGVSLMLLFMGYGLLALAIGHLTGHAVGITCGRILCWRICPSLSMSPLRISREGFRRVLSLGGRFQLLAFLNMTGDQAMKMLIAYLTGISSLALYELADKLVGLGRTVSASLIAPLMPAFANLHAGQEHERWCSLFMGVSKLVAATASVSLGFLFVFADRLIILWTGHDYALAAWTIRATVLCHYVTLLTGVGTASLRAKGTLKLEIIYVIISCLIILALIWPAFLWAGYKGIVLAFAVGQSAAAIWFLVAFSRLEGVNVLQFCRETLSKVGLIGVASAGVAYVLRPWAAISVPSWPDRWMAVFDVSVGIPIFGIVTGMVLWFSVFSASERRNMVRYLMSKREDAAPSSTSVS